ncbi:MAG: hypothetical protein R3B70_45640 [Polyangiaceae bacterium]
MFRRHSFTWILVVAFPLAASAACSAGGGGKLTGGGGEGGSAGGGTGLGGEGGFFNPGGTGGFNNNPGVGDLPTPTCSQDCADFPKEPIFEAGVPADAPDLFGAPDNYTPGGPCVLEPQLSNGGAPGAMVPANWLRPRFKVAATEDLFEIRITSPVEANPLVAYTTSKEWKIPADIWAKAAPNSAGKALTVTIRALNMASPGTPTGVSGDFHIAPVNAGGAMVFWSVNDSAVTADSSKLYGFTVGDEGVAEALSPKKVKFSGILHEGGVDLRGDYDPKPGFAAGEVRCIGCHTSTPDGEAVIFTDDWPWNKGIASVKPESVGEIPSYLSPGARALLKMPWIGTQSMSKAHWAPGDRLLIASFGQRDKPFSPNKQNDRLMWIDLEATAPIDDTVPSMNSGMRQQAAEARNAAITAARGSAWDTFAMDGESASAVTPDISNARDRIAYVSTDVSPNGHSDYTATKADIRIVPFNDRKGGAVADLAGAATPDSYEYYPAFSPDDSLIAFTRAPHKGVNPDGPYQNRLGEVYVVPSAGGAITRLVANDPVACAGDDLSKGLMNSWPKWAPKALSVDGKTYYFVIFSSARKYDKQFLIPAGQYTPQTLDRRSSQLYMAAIVVDEATGAITTYPAVYLWNQSRVVAGGVVTDVEMSSNLTPAWDDFQIPDVEVPK